jgi:hypothetical protein
MPLPVVRRISRRSSTPVEVDRLARHDERSLRSAIRGDVQCFLSVRDEK